MEHLTPPHGFEDEPTYSSIISSGDTKAIINNLEVIINSDHNQINLHQKEYSNLPFIRTEITSHRLPDADRMYDGWIFLGPEYADSKDLREKHLNNMCPSNGFVANNVIGTVFRRMEKGEGIEVETDNGKTIRIQYIYTDKTESNPCLVLDMQDTINPEFMSGGLVHDFDRNKKNLQYFLKVYIYALSSMVHTGKEELKRAYHQPKRYQISPVFIGSSVKNEKFVTTENSAIYNHTTLLPNDSIATLPGLAVETRSKLEAIRYDYEKPIPERPTPTTVILVSKDEKYNRDVSHAFAVSTGSEYHSIDLRKTAKLPNNRMSEKIDSIFNKIAENGEKKVLFLEGFSDFTSRRHKKLSIMRKLAESIADIAQLSNAITFLSIESVAAVPPVINTSSRGASFS